MAGHSKWANIQHRKGKQDAKKGKLFTKLIRAITSAARMGGADPSASPRLRDAIDEARGANMTNDTIDRAIKRGVGDQDGAQLEEVTYEGYGPSGVAVMVECLTDNRNRTVAEVRHAFSKCGGNLGTDGSVAYLFTKRGQFTFAPGNNEDHIMEIALEAGADDVQSNEDGSIDVLTTPEDFSTVKAALQQAGLSADGATITQLASLQVSLDKESAEKMLRLVDMLEDLDDVQQVYSNADIADDIMAELE
ncbi:YebC/PmpR family DNA-binding transcriptional regulator [soil metagenome]